MVMVKATGLAPDLVLPRFGTVRDLSRVSYGAEVAEVARRLRRPFMPWQQHVADIATEVDPVSGQLWYEEVVVTVPRQSGKTILILALMVWRCVMLARRLGPQTVTYLAQKRQSARKKLEREFVPLLARSIGFKSTPHAKARPVKPSEYKASLNNGSEHVLFGTGSYLQIEAVGDTSSHGDVLDMTVTDEAFVHETDAVEQAVDAATVTRQSPQSYVVSTAGNRKSVFLWLKVLAGRKQVGDSLSRTCYFEWSVGEDEAFDDPEVWRRRLPALGHTITEERLQARLAKARANPDEVDDEGFEPGIPGFRRGYLNQWVDVPLLQDELALPEIVAGVWMGEPLVDPQSKIVSDVVLGVGVAQEGAAASIVVVGRRADGLPHVECLIRQPGIWWLEKSLRDLVAVWRPRMVGWAAGGPARVVQPDIERAARTGVDCGLQPLSGREWAAACEAFAQSVKEGRVRHLGDVLLDDAVSGAVRREVGAGWEWDLRGSQSDVTPLVAATAGLRALELLQTEPVEEIFAY